jgi:hypothetical protein
MEVDFGVAETFEPPKLESISSVVNNFSGVALLMLLMFPVLSIM